MMTQTETAHASSARSHRNHTRYRITVNSFAVLVAVAATAALTLLLHSRDGLATSAIARVPLPVAVAEFELQDGYRRDRSFLGLIRAAHSSDLGFAVAGALATLPVSEGAVVKAGAVLATLDTDPLSARRVAAAAQLEQVRAELELARIKAQRQRELKGTGAASVEAFDETRLVARALAAQEQMVSAQLRAIDIELDQSIVRAPYDGVVAERLANVGAVLGVGTPVLRLVASGPREAHVGVAAEQADRLHPGESYTVVVRGGELAARLRSIRPDIDPRTLTATAVFELPAATPAYDGEPVSLRLHETVPTPGGWIPLAALLEGQRGVWTVLSLQTRGGQTVTAREVVEVLTVRGDRAYVRGTLSDAQRYVSDGVHRVAPGTAIEALGT